MRMVPAALLALAACAGPAPDPGTAGPPKADRELLARSLVAMLESPALVARFDAAAAAPGRPLRTFRGRIRWYRGGVVLLRSEDPARNVMRIGPSAWAFDGASGGWTPWTGPEGTGWQDPFDLLARLPEQQGLFRASRDEAVGGVPFRAFAASWEEPAGASTFAPFGASGTPALALEATVLADGDSVRRVRLSGRAGAVRYDVTVDFESWGRVPPMRFDDVPIPFTPDMSAAVRKASGEGAPR